MGEIAEDCYDRALEEMENLDCDPDYYGYEVRRAPTRRRAATPEDFENLDE